ncbi:DUF488 family protein [Nubsella zeaxanthinifaciens]|uniref:DUF488 domain-containing protein n=1 Tax=Nubsella zeaxanthinifaciens TaxID=392412 RepID=UPI003CFD7C8E
MFYRRKIILALLELFGGELEKIRLQKLLFLFSQQQTKPEYEFIPYKYGCYSYSANADLTTMVAKSMLIENTSSFVKSDKTSYLKLLKLEDKLKLNSIKSLYGAMNSDALMKHTYKNFPYWAINSVKAASILTSEELKNVKKHKSTNDSITLFTIGYEGISLEGYLNRLVQNNVKLLIDVRRNPLSMKFGFSKSLLKRYCESLDIYYLHIPEVGIVSDQRQELNTQSDYDALFKVYRKENLVNTKAEQQQILNLLVKYKRVALTCFEANICQCHRKHLADAIVDLPNFDYQLKHI